MKTSLRLIVGVSMTLPKCIFRISLPFLFYKASSTRTCKPHTTQFTKYVHVEPPIVRLLRRCQRIFSDRRRRSTFLWYEPWLNRDRNDQRVVRSARVYNANVYDDRNGQTRPRLTRGVVVWCRSFYAHIFVTRLYPNYLVFLRSYLEFLFSELQEFYIFYRSIFHILFGNLSRRSKPHRIT